MRCSVSIEACNLRHRTLRRCFVCRSGYGNRKCFRFKQSFLLLFDPFVVLRQAGLFIGFVRLSGTPCLALVSKEHRRARAFLFAKTYRLTTVTVPAALAKRYVKVMVNSMSGYRMKDEILSCCGGRRTLAFAESFDDEVCAPHQADDGTAAHQTQKNGCPTEMIGNDTESVGTDRTSQIAEAV